MSKIMDRVSDLDSVEWKSVPKGMLLMWEREAIGHDANCRCHKCAVLFARVPECSPQYIRPSAISPDVIAALRAILRQSHNL